MKRLTALLLFAAMLSGLTACGSEKDVPEVMPKQDFESEEELFADQVFTASPEAVEYPMAEEASFSLTYPVSELTKQGQTRFLETWQKAAGVTIEANAVPAESYEMQVVYNVSAGDIRDVTMYANQYLFDEDADTYLELREVLSENAPNYIAAVNALPDGPYVAYEEDGTIWRMLQLYDTPQLMDGFGLMLRQDYLEELHMEAPETYADYHDYFLAVKDTFHADQPFRMLPSGVTGCNNFSAGFGISLGSRTMCHGFYQVDGTVHYGALEQGFTDYLMLLHGWYQEGIINSKFLDEADVGSNSYLIDIANHDYGGFFLPLSAVDTLEGMCSYPITPGMDPVRKSGDWTHLAANSATIRYGTGFTLSADCEDPALVVRALDWLYTEEGFLAASYGTEGESYTVKDGKPEYTDLILNNPEGLDLPEAICAYTSIDLAGRMAAENLKLRQAEGREVLEVWNRQKDTAYMISEGVKMTQEESEDYTARAADISTYVDSLIPQFILGERDLEEIPKVQEKIREMGIEECMEFWQTALDRYRE